MSRRLIAAATVGVLGLLVAVAVMPFLLGLLGAPVLAVTFAPMHAWLRRRMGARLSAGIVVVAAVLAILLPATALTVLIVSELPSVLAGPTTRVPMCFSISTSFMLQIGQSPGSLVT